MYTFLNCFPAGQNFRGQARRLEYMLSALKTPLIALKGSFPTASAGTLPKYRTWEYRCVHRKMTCPIRCPGNLPLSSCLPLFCPISMLAPTEGVKKETASPHRPLETVLR